MKIDDVMERILMEYAPFIILMGGGIFWRGRLRGGFSMRLRGFEARGYLMLNY